MLAAAARVADATLAIRNPLIWGEAGTACASDSTKFGAWDRNLMTEWHARYGGRGMMIYWHVERQATCIYSQLKRCSSSEVAAMIEGVLRHCTDMEIQRQYVDSHGQSAIGFALIRTAPNTRSARKGSPMDVATNSPPTMSLLISRGQTTNLFSSCSSRCPHKHARACWALLPVRIAILCNNTSIIVLFKRYFVVDPSGRVRLGDVVEFDLKFRWVEKQ